ncbi:HAMP domain-containing sensor histidine kinase [Pigmentibacter sp. JX0631]|uniref:sensor histidine kinase n=1 Tax=Pigmentibacter sp. JX0631 TaxID=2976982 RepID=UPI002469180C|nr:HAMP domain-containing sensor histidine kinase [Pigmentibacter sp. JX0631]WGL58778.1 HAMP domain-containing sensor histidine kinase [Pigmentibacter sp. JX0631]
MKNIIKNSKFVFFFIYCIIPIVIIKSFNQPTNIVFGIHEGITELSLLIIISTIMLKKYHKCGNKTSSIYIALVFFITSLLIADFIYMLTIVFPDKESLLTFKLSILMYDISFLAILYILVKKMYIKIKSYYIHVLTIIFAIIFGFISLHYVLIPYLNSSSADKIVQLLCTIFSLIEIVVVAVSISLSFIVKKLNQLIFLAGIVLMAFGDLVIRYEQVFNQNGPQTYYEYTWSLGVFLIAISFIKVKDLLDFRKENFSTFFSLRCLFPISGVLTALVIYTFFVLSIEFEKISIFKLSREAIIFYFILISLNIVSLKFSIYLTKTLKKVYFNVSASNPEEKINPVLQEVEEIVKEYYIANEKLKNLCQVNILQEREINKYEIEKVKYLLSSKLSHDIRGPITILRILFKETEKELEQSQAKIITNQIERISSIIDELILVNLSKSSTITKQYFCNTKKVIEEIIVEKTEKLYKDLKIKFSVQIENLSPAKMCPIELTRILSNIINNAYEASQNKNAQIFINLSKSEDNFNVIAVKDHGKGIKVEDLNKIGNFGVSIGKEHFTHAGFGLGLYYAKLTIEKWGGKLFIQSEENVGTTVFLHIPIHLTK